MKLRGDSRAELQKFAGGFGTNRDTHVVVNGYTDNVGSANSNMRLSQERADAVKADLVALGIPADRISAQGLGEQDPIADNDTADGRRSNRRVSVAIGNR
jgi:outer membrane protein OmpA-like peptidoglycan-associated protein